MSQIAVQVENLSKMYRIDAEQQRPDNVWDIAAQVSCFSASAPVSVFELSAQSWV